jgi:hypothetical protein
MMEHFGTNIVSVLNIQNRGNSSGRRGGRGVGPGRDMGICKFCREIGHFVSQCPEVDKYLKEGKIRKTLEGRIQLSNGIYCPKSITGLWLKEHIDKWHC